jgi:hypothetical protein
MNFAEPVRKRREMQRRKRFMIKASVLVALAFGLAACAPTPTPEPVPETVPGIDPVTGQSYDLTPGLNDLEPDVCKGQVYAPLIGQPASAVAAAGITQPVRVIPLGSLITEEYSSQRIDFYLDAAGNIAKITCG